MPTEPTWMERAYYSVGNHCQTSGGTWATSGVIQSAAGSRSAGKVVVRPKQR